MVVETLPVDLSNADESGAVLLYRLLTRAPRRNLLRFFSRQRGENKLRKLSFPSECFRLIQSKAQQVFIGVESVAKFREHRILHLSELGEEFLARAKARLREGAITRLIVSALFSCFHVFVFLVVVYLVKYGCKKTDDYADIASRCFTPRTW